MHAALTCFHQPISLDIDFAISISQKIAAVWGEKIVLFSYPTLSLQFLLLGHKAKITTLTAARVEIDDIPERDNALISADQNGMVVLWNLADGANLASIVLPQIAPLSLVLCQKYILCSGQSNVVFILNMHSLTLLKTVNVADDWISSGCLTSNDKLIFSSFSGALLMASIKEDEQDCNLAVDPKACFNLEKDSPALLESNPWDSSIFLSLQDHSFSVNIFLIQIYAVKKSTFSKLFSIPPPAKSVWTGAKFVSMKTVIIWTRDLKAHLYYLGDSTDVKVERTPHHDSQVLLASINGLYAYVDRNKCFQEVGLKYSLLAELHSLAANGCICIIRESNGFAFQAVAFSDDGSAAFWDMSATSSNEQIPSNSILGTKHSVERSYQTRTVYSHDAVTAIIHLMGKYFAVGFGLFLLIQQVAISASFPFTSF